MAVAWSLTPSLLMYSSVPTNRKQAVRPRQRARQNQAAIQAQEQRQVTQTESLSVVKLLLNAGIGCITYLRCARTLKPRSLGPPALLGS